MQKKECSFCKKKYSTYKKTRKFCSTRCCGDSQRKSQKYKCPDCSGKKSWKSIKCSNCRYKIRKNNKICLFCKKTYIKYSTTFCSRKCAHDNLKKYKPCFFCKELFRSPSGIKKRIFCSKKCHSQQNSGKNNFLWEGGKMLDKEYQRARHLLQTHKRRALKIGSGGSHTLEEWANLKYAYGYSCLRCGEKEPFENQRYLKLTQDHINPICKNGSDSINNIQPLCLDCNNWKNGRAINYRWFVPKNNSK